MDFVGSWASLIVTTTTSEIPICLEYFHLSSTTSTHTFPALLVVAFLVLVCSFNFLSLVVFSSLAYLV
jgi:hypothetical protein